jgi:hypothetical protein
MGQINLLLQDIILIIIAFSRKTSKLLPRLICRDFKHVAPILIKNGSLCMWQFIRKNNVEKVSLTIRDLRLLQGYGWCFIVLWGIDADDVIFKNCYTCVQMAKRVLRIKNLWIQTPDTLYKMLNNVI